MRQSARLCLIAVVLAVCAVSSTAQTVSNTVCANYNFFLVNSTVAPVFRVIITPIQQYQNCPWAGSSLSHSPLVNGMALPSPVFYSVAANPSLTNGVLTVSNVWTGIPYDVEVYGYGHYGFTNYFDVGLGGQTVDGTTNQAYIMGAIVFPKGANGSNGTNGTNTTSVLWNTITNLSGARSATLLWIYPTNQPYNQTNHPYSLITTN